MCLCLCLRVSSCWAAVRASFLLFDAYSVMAWVLLQRARSAGGAPVVGAASTASSRHDRVCVCTECLLRRVLAAVDCALDCAMGSPGTHARCSPKLRVVPSVPLSCPCTKPTHHPAFKANPFMRCMHALAVLGFVSLTQPAYAPPPHTHVLSHISSTHSRATFGLLASHVCIPCACMHVCVCFPRLPWRASSAAAH